MTEMKKADPQNLVKYIFFLTDIKYIKKEV